MNKRVKILSSEGGRAVLQLPKHLVVVERTKMGYSVNLQDLECNPVTPKLTAPKFESILSSPKFGGFRKAIGDRQALADLVILLQQIVLSPPKDSAEGGEGEGNIFDNDVDPEWVASQLPKVLPYLKRPDLEALLMDHCQRHVECSNIAAQGMVYNQVNVAAPPIRKFGVGLPDYIPLRGQVELLLRKMIGTGGGMVAAYLRKVGVRVLPFTRVSRPALERLAKSGQLSHLTLVMEEIRTLYPKTFQGEQYVDSDVAVSLRGMIENGFILVVLADREDPDKLVTTKVETPIASVITSTEELQDAAMYSRYDVAWLPRHVHEVAGIGRMLLENIGISQTQVDSRHSALTGSEVLTDEVVKAIYHTIFCLWQGLLEGNAEAEKMLEDGGLSRDLLLPVLDVDFDEHRLALLKNWLKALVLRNVPESFKYVERGAQRTLQGGSEPEEKDIEAKELIGKIDKARTFKALDSVFFILEQLGIDVKDEGVTRLLLDAVRRLRGSAGLHQLLLPFEVVSKNGRSFRILKAEKGDFQKGIEHLRLQSMIKSEFGRRKYTDAVIVSIVKRFGEKGVSIKKLAAEYTKTIGKRAHQESLRPMAKRLVEEGILEKRGRGVKGDPIKYFFKELPVDEEKENFTVAWDDKVTGTCSLCGRTSATLFKTSDGRMCYGCIKERRSGG